MNIFGLPKYIFLILFLFGLNAYSKDFVLVIDAGHGGHDPGAVGKISKEKDINLRVALAFGNLVKEKCPEVKVVYTRDRDVFIPLSRRADIANNAKADLFVSIHTNAVDGSKSVVGASTWTLGLARTDANLEVAKRENSVILYEDDYKQKYAGFNPYSSESYIIFELIQDQYMEQSVAFASTIQKEFKYSAGRSDRGVHQAGFLVLKASAMPSVLIELGFISTPSEEKYLNSKAGTAKLSEAIFNAFLKYKEDWELKNNHGEDTGKKAKVVADSKSGKTKEKKDTDTVLSSDKKGNDSDGELVFMVQILTSSKILDEDSNYFKGVRGVSYYKENGLYKYTCCKSSDYDYVNSKRRELEKKFDGAFVIAFKNGIRTDINKAIKEYRNKKTKNK